MKELERLRELAVWAESKKGNSWTHGKAQAFTAFIGATNPAVVLALLDVVGAAEQIRKRLEYPETGVGLTERRRELLAYDTARARLESVLSGKGDGK